MRYIAITNNNMIVDKMETKLSDEDIYQLDEFFHRNSVLAHDESLVIFGESLDEESFEGV